MGANVKYGEVSNPVQFGRRTGSTLGGFGSGQFLSSLFGVGLGAMTGNPLGLLAIILPSLIGGIGAIGQGRKATRYYEDYLAMLNQNKSDMRASLQARQNAYLDLEKIVFGNQISNPPTWSNYGSESSNNSYLSNKSFRR